MTNGFVMSATRLTKHESIRLDVLWQWMTFTGSGTDMSVALALVLVLV